MKNLVEQLRNSSCNPGCTHTNMMLFMQAADRIEELERQLAAQTAPVVPEVHLPDRVIDTLISTAGVSTFHPDGSQREKLHSLVHGVAAEVLARLPLSAAPSAPIQANGEDAHYKQQRDRLLDFIKHAPVSSGVCCCGDSMTNHASPMTCGHGPVDQWDHSVSCIVRDIDEDDAAIAATAQQKEGE